MASGSPPAAPDPYATAAAQTQQNQQSAAYNAALNRFNVTTPIGSQSFSTSGVDPQTGAPIYNENISLAPAQQQLLTAQQQQALGVNQASQSLIPQIQNAFSNPVSQGQLNPLTTNVQGGPLQTNVQGGPIQGQLNTQGVPGIAGAGNLAGFTQQARDAAYQQQAQYLDPQFKQGEEQLRSQLINSGAAPGSAAYDNAMLNFNNQKQQAYQSAQNNAIQQGLAEQQALYGESANTNQQLFGQALQGGQFANTAQNQQFGQGLTNASLANTAQQAQFGQGQQNAALGNQASNQQLQQLFSLQQQPLNNFNALQTGQQVQMPQFGQAAQAQTNPAQIGQYMQNQYQGALDQYNAGVSTGNAEIGGAASIIAAALLA